MEVKVIPSNPTYIENMFDEAEMGLIDVSYALCITSDTDFSIVCFVDAGYILTHLMLYEGVDVILVIHKCMYSSDMGYQKMIS